MHTGTNEFVRMNSDVFVRMHSYELSNYTNANANQDMFVNVCEICV